MIQKLSNLIKYIDSNTILLEEKIEQKKITSKKLSLEQKKIISKQIFK